MSGSNTYVGSTTAATTAVRFTAEERLRTGIGVFGEHGEPFLLIPSCDADAMPRAQALARLLNGPGWGGVVLLQEVGQLLRGYEAHHRAHVEALAGEGLPIGEARAAAVDAQCRAISAAQAKAERNGQFAARIEAWLAGADIDSTIGGLPDHLQGAERPPELQLVVNGVAYRTRAQEVKGQIGGQKVHVVWDGRTGLSIEVGPYDPGSPPQIVFGSDGPLGGPSTYHGQPIDGPTPCPIASAAVDEAMGGAGPGPFAPTYRVEGGSTRPVIHSEEARMHARDDARYGDVDMPGRWPTRDPSTWASAAAAPPIRHHPLCAFASSRGAKACDYDCARTEDQLREPAVPTEPPVSSAYPGRSVADFCTCGEVEGEDPNCPVHGEDEAVAECRGCGRPDGQPHAQGCPGDVVEDVQEQRLRRTSPWVRPEVRRTKAGDAEGGRRHQLFPDGGHSRDS